MRRLVLWAAVAVAVQPATAAAGFVFVTDRAGIGATGVIDWGQLPLGSNPPGNGTTTVTSTPVMPNTFAPTAVARNGSTTPFSRLEQGPGGANQFPGGFAPGDQLLGTNGVNGPMTIDFAADALVTAAGANIQPTRNGNYTIRVTGLDATGLEIAGAFFELNFTVSPGFTTPFLGIRGTDGDGFDQLRFTAVRGDFGNDFLINQVSFAGAVVLAPPPAVGTPLPPTALAAGVGLIGLIGARRVRRTGVRA